MTNGLEQFLLCHVSNVSHKQLSTDLQVNYNSSHKNCNTNKGKKIKITISLKEKIVCHYY